jgi:hypothetical protein
MWLGLGLILAIVVLLACMRADDRRRATEKGALSEQWLREHRERDDEESPNMP